MREIYAGSVLRQVIKDPKKGVPRLKRYLDDFKGMPLHDVWTDIRVIHNRSPERVEYRTQKPEALLDRIIRSSSNEGDIVLDCFIGSRTTAAVAQKLGRRWIGCDVNKGALQTTSKRLQAIIRRQIFEASLRRDNEQRKREQAEFSTLLAAEEPAVPPAAPAQTQLSFTVHRVNDYDLAIQHNEAVNLACEHIGVTRMLTDSFFDGTLGKKLVKIIPFGHPLSLTDLEDVKQELDARGNEARDVVVVSLGKELGVDGWLADWNRMRKQGDTPNKIEIIELRSDPKYGKFIAHKPASARVEVRRAKGKLTVEVKDFLSPTILERLQEQAGPLLAPKVPDWRALVDSVMIDPADDGQIFNIALADVPERKQDYVQATYELDAPPGPTTVAVKITDMLGEEVLVVREV